MKKDKPVNDFNSYLDEQINKSRENLGELARIGQEIQRKLDQVTTLRIEGQGAIKVLEQMKKEQMEPDKTEQKTDKSAPATPEKK